MKNLITPRLTKAIKHWLWTAHIKHGKLYSLRPQDRTWILIDVLRQKGELL